MKRIWLYLISTAFLAGLTLAGGAAGYFYWAARQPVAYGSESFTIEPGSGVKQIAARLVSAEVLPEPYTFTVWAFYKDYTTRIHAGEYAIPPDSTVDTLLARFVAGDVIRRNVTLIEGWTFAEFRGALYQADKLELKTRDMQRGEIMALLGAADTDPEGRFFPETYSYTADMSDVDILEGAFRMMASVLAEEWDARDPSVPLQSPEETLVLASIIEKETGRAGERDTIAAVFHNRLEKGMRLQTDPTVIYGLGDEFDGNLTRAHLRADTPWNTYTRFGLPPTPIAMPGRASIHAALNPSDSDALYFVSRGDGSHVFSKTLAEHNRNVARYQLNGGRRAETGDAESAGSAGEAEASNGNP